MGHAVPTHGHEHSLRACERWLGLLPQGPGVPRTLCHPFGSAFGQQNSLAQTHGDPTSPRHWLYRGKVSLTTHHQGHQALHSGTGSGHFLKLNSLTFRGTCRNLTQTAPRCLPPSAQNRTMAISRSQASCSVDPGQSAILEKATSLGWGTNKRQGCGLKNVKVSLVWDKPGVMYHHRCCSWYQGEAPKREAQSGRQGWSMLLGL